MQTFTQELTPDLSFGNSTASAGDVNNDGFDDIIVGAPGYENGLGIAYIYFGGELMDDVVDVTFIIESNTPNTHFGAAVSSAGDVNNDGYDDVIVGAYGYNFEDGRVFIYYGGEEMDDIPDIVLSDEFGIFGAAVSTAGDLNDDGFDDVLVGAFYNTYATGKAYVYYGGSLMDDIPDLMMTGEQYNNYFGTVSSAGDVNNDGFLDVLDGASGYSTAVPPAHNFVGRAYIYYGGPDMDDIADVIMEGEDGGNYFGGSVSGLGDVNGDGIDDIIVGADGYNELTGRAYIYFGGEDMDNTPDIVMTGEEMSSGFGNSVSGAGDINNDMHNDVIVGAFANDGYVGKTYVYYGSENMDDVADETMIGEAEGDGYGGSVSRAGDVNNDGYDEYMVGARGVNEFTGKVYIYTSINVAV